MQYIVTPVMTFINASYIDLSNNSLKTVAIHVNSLEGSLEGSLVAAKCQLQCLWGNCALHKILPIMLALCLMLLPSFYAQNYAGIIGSSLKLSSYSYIA